MYTPHTHTPLTPPPPALPTSNAPITGNLDPTSVFLHVKYTRLLLSSTPITRAVTVPPLTNRASVLFRTRPSLADNSPMCMGGINPRRLFATDTTAPCSSALTTMTSSVMPGVMSESLTMVASSVDFLREHTARPSMARQPRMRVVT